MPLVRRVPKRGFTNIFRTEYSVVNVAALEGLEGTVGPEELVAAGLARKGMPIKILASGEVTGALTVKAHKFSAAARQKIEAAGGQCKELGS